MSFVINSKTWSCMLKFRGRFLISSSLLLAFPSCKKLVQISEPINSITTSETFSTPQKATSAVTGIYSDMSYGAGFLRYANGLTSVNAGLAADELTYFGGISAFETNSILQDDGYILEGFWNPPYSHIYATNAAIEGIGASNTLPKTLKDQLIGECKFIRAFCYFYLTNWFGDVPLVTTTSFVTNSTMKRTPVELVYKQIIADLKSAQALLPEDFSLSKGERVRANKWAATALLARTYLFVGAYDSAATQASAVIEQASIFGLATLDSAFLKNNTEAILQLQPVNANLHATSEPTEFLPLLATKDYTPDYIEENWPYFVPAYPLTTELINAFEPGDLRKFSWADTTGNVQGVNYYYPHKYKIRQSSSDDMPEYYTVLRLAEVYLVRAEARAQGNNLTGAKEDLDIIRARAGLGAISVSDRAAMLTAILHERQVEFFAEWGHRWLDLKRTKQADAILGSLKGANWNTNDQLWPIPQSEIINDPNLTQNTGY